MLISVQNCTQILDLAQILTILILIDHVFSAFKDLQGTLVSEVISSFLPLQQLTLLLILQVSNCESRVLRFNRPIKEII